VGLPKGWFPDFTYLETELQDAGDHKKRKKSYDECRRAFELIDRLEEGQGLLVRKRSSKGVATTRKKDADGRGYLSAEGILADMGCAS